MRGGKGGMDEGWKGGGGVRGGKGRRGGKGVRGGLESSRRMRGGVSWVRCRSKEVRG